MATTVASSDQSPFASSDLWSAVRNHWLLIGVIATLIAAASLVVALLMTPIYRAETLVTAAEDDSQAGLSQLIGGLGGVAAMAGLDVGGRNNIEVSLAMLSSDGFTAEFIKENDLMQELYWKEWDAKLSRWKSDDPDDVPSMTEAVRDFDTGVRFVSRDRRSGMIRVAIEWRDREKAAVWANALVKRVNVVSRQQAIGEATRSIEYLEKELAKTNVVELRQAIYRLIESQINSTVLANVREEFAFRIIDQAVAPDAKFKVRPKRLYIVLFGAFFGGVVGMGTALVLQMKRRKAALAGGARASDRPSGHERTGIIG